MMRNRSLTARTAAEQARGLLSAERPLKEIWRFTILQLLDDYQSMADQNPAAAAQMFLDEPAPTTDSRVNSALASLAEHLARRDGWAVPPWTQEPERTTSRWWFVTDLAGLHPLAMRESPLSFRKRGVFITAEALSRV